MSRLLLLAVIALCLASSNSCPFTASAMPQALSCIQNIVCVISASGQERALIQNCNKSWHYGSSSAPMTRLTEPHATSPASFISNSKLSSKIKANGEFALIQFGNSDLYFFPLGSNNYKYNLPAQCHIRDFESLTLSNSTPVAVVACNRSVATFVLDPSGNIVAKNQISIADQISKVTCLPDREKCVVGTQEGYLYVIDVLAVEITTNVWVGANVAVDVLQVKATDSKKNYKIYVALSNGIISQYRLKGKWLALQRTSSHFKGSTIHGLGSFYSSSYLIVTDKAGNVSQIDLETGILLESVSVEPYLSAKTSLGMSLLLDSQTSYYIYNTANRVIFNIVVNPDITTDALILSCLNLHYYNDTQQGCAACSPTCGTCHPLTGECLDCIDQYFNSGGVCESCYFNSNGLMEHFEECFSKNEQRMMETSKETVKFISLVVSNLAVALNVFGLLFLFLKLINNWNLISLYFFVPIEMPFFLQNVLKMIFTSLNSSVLQAVGVSVDWQFSVPDKSRNAKFEVLGVSTDFLAMNAESLILFLYSLLLTATVYKFVNYLLAKVNISIFEQNTAISNIEEFIGCFTTSLLPFYYVISRPILRNPLDKLNSACYYLFFGVALIVPFCFLIFDYQYKYIRTNKVHNNDENAIADSVNLGLTKRIRAWREDDSKQSFWYGVLSFSTAVLACHPRPIFFIVGVGIVNVLCLVNALSCRQRRGNVILQKCLFVMFHCCFSSLHFVTDGHTKLKLSLLLVLLLILIAVHEMILSLYKKIYFIYILIKGKIEKQAKIAEFLLQNQQKLVKKNREHPISLNLKPTSHEALATQVRFKFNQFELRIPKQTLDNINRSEGQKKSPSKNKSVKTAKRIGDHRSNNRVVFEEIKETNRKRGVSSKQKKQ